MIYIVKHSLTFRVLVMAFSLFTIGKIGHAQSEETMLSEVVDIYNKAIGVVDDVRSRPDKYDVMDSIRNVSETAMERLRILKLSTNPSMAKNARYFYMNFKYNFAFGYTAVGKNTTATKYMSELIEDMNYFDASQFPLHYVSNGTNYVINYENFSSTRCTYYVAYAELLYKAYEYGNCIEYTRKAIPLLNNDQWLSYVCYYYGITSKVNLSQYDGECIQYCSRQLNAYYNLSAANIDTIKAYDFGTYRMATNNLDKALEKGALTSTSYPDLVSGINILKYYLDPYKEKDDSQRKRNKFILLRWYHEAVMSEFSDKEFVKSAFAFSEVYADAGSNDNASWLKRFERFNLDCADYQWMIEQYNKLGDSANAARLTPNLTSCKEKEAKAAKEAEEARIKTEKKNTKKYRNSSDMPLFFVGVNVIPLLSKPRDFGLVVNFGGEKMVTEISYLKVNHKAESYFDLTIKGIDDIDEHRWDGYFTHINFKFPTDGWDDGQRRPYTGLLFAYNERTFDPFQVNVTPIATSVPYQLTVAPTSKQYSALINFGYMRVTGFAIDVFMGFGASYNQFDAHIKEYRDPDYLISDELLANRASSYWSLMVRAGISFGFGYARD